MANGEPLPGTVRYNSATNSAQVFRPATPGGTNGWSDLGSSAPGSGYTLPVATADDLGGIKVPATSGLVLVGDGLTVAYGTTANTAARGNDSRITGALAASDARVAPAPTGNGLRALRANAAGTALEYYVPTDTSVVYGTTADTAAEGNDSRITGALAASDARVPPAPTGNDLLALRANSDGTALEYYTPPSVIYGTTANTAAEGNDARIVGALAASDARVAPAPTGNGLRALRANAGGTALEYYAPPYDIAVYADGLLTDAETVLRFVVPRDFTLAAGASGVATAGAAATAETVLTVARNGTTIGTVTWAAAASVATVSITAEVIFDAGDMLSITGPATADATLADVGITLTGIRS